MPDLVRVTPSPEWFVRREVGLYGTRPDHLVAVDDDVDMRDDGLAEEVDLRRQCARTARPSLCDQRLRIAPRNPRA